MFCAALKLTPQGASRRESARCRLSEAAATPAAGCGCPMYDLSSVQLHMLQFKTHLRSSSEVVPACLPFPLTAYAYRMLYQYTYS